MKLEKKRSARSILILLGLAGVLALPALVCSLPPVTERLAWRIENARVQVRRLVNPPEQVVFVPVEQVEAIVQATLLALTPPPSETPPPTFTPTLPGPTHTPTSSATPAPSPSPTPTPTPLPAIFTLSNVPHEYQSFNNCGPANLSMALRFWGWQGDQRATGAYLRPDPRDKNVMPHEMVAYTAEQAGLKAVWRAGGDADLLKRLVAAGYVVIIEKGYYPPKDDWLGHYLLISGYDDERGIFLAQNSLIMPDYPVPYELLADRWRDFNNLFVLVYPVDREEQAMRLLGPYTDPLYAFQMAALRAEQETGALSGVDQYFAWFNLGSSLVELGKVPEAAQAFDQAFALYPSLPRELRPWRLLWYRENPYAAYFYSGRYQDVINLANTTFTALGEYTLEESFYWRGMAKEASGDLGGAIQDFQQAVGLNPRSTNAAEALRRLGVEVSP